MFANEDIETVAAALAAHVPFSEPTQTVRRPAAVAMILAPGREGLEALFMKRAEHPDDPWSGHMSFPGGGKCEQDYDVESAARRETLEEVGLILTRDMLIGRLDDITGGRLEWFDMAVAGFVYYLEQPGKLRPNNEVADTVWVPLSFLGDPANVGEFLWERDPERRLFPAFHYGPYTIWGLTYRFVVQFMGLFNVALPNYEKVTTPQE